MNRRKRKKEWIEKRGREWIEERKGKNEYKKEKERIIDDSMRESVEEREKERKNMKKKVKAQQEKNNFCSTFLQFKIKKKISIYTSEWLINSSCKILHVDQYTDDSFVGFKSVYAKKGKEKLLASEMENIQ